MTTIWRHATTSEDAELVRKLRNQGRSWFHQDHYINEENQAMWWHRMMGLPPQDFVCLVPAIIRPGMPVGYGMLARRGDGRLWVSLAVDTASHGQGMGAEIYKLLARQMTTEPVYAAIRRDNLASRRAAEKAGYIEDRTVTAPNVPDVGVAADWPVMRGGCQP